jgi:hypothetical protein
MEGMAAAADGGSQALAALMEQQSSFPPLFIQSSVCLLASASISAGDMEGMAAAGDGASQALAALMEQQPLLEVVVRFNEGLLRQQSNNRNTLISRLVAVIQVGQTGQKVSHGTF